MNTIASIDTRKADVLPFSRLPLKKLNGDTVVVSKKHNHLLAALPAEILSRLYPNLELVSMQIGEVICESSSQLHHVYFPTTAILSLHYRSRSRQGCD